MQVQRVDRVELGHVHQIDAHRPRLVDADRRVHVGLAHGVDRVNLVCSVEVGVEGVHHHRQFLPSSILGAAERARGCHGRILGVPGGIGVNHEQAIHALVNVPLQRQGVAMIEVASERLGVELVDELFAGTNQTGTRNAVHSRRMDAVEVHRMRVRSIVAEDDPQPLAFLRPQCRSGHAVIEGPGRKEDAGRDLDLPVDGSDFEGAQRSAIGQKIGQARFPLRQHGCRVEAVPVVIDHTDRCHVAMRHAGHGCCIGVGRHGGHVVARHRVWRGLGPRDTRYDGGATRGGQSTDQQRASGRVNRPCVAVRRSDGPGRLQSGRRIARLLPDIGSHGEGFPCGQHAKALARQVRQG